MTQSPPSIPAETGTSPVAVGLIVVMWLAWIAVILVADFFAFLMIAFADSPSSNKAAQLLIAPLFLWFAVTFVAGVLLLVFRGWWQVPLAFVLAASPPFLMFAGYNLLASAGNVRLNIPTGPPPPPPTPMNVPPGGFRPPTLPASPTSQPNVQELIRKTSQEAEATRRAVDEATKPSP